MIGQNASIHPIGVRCRGFSYDLFKIFLLGWLCAPGWSCADEWRGRVVRIQDGDSLVVSREGRQEKVRLAGIDTPEQGQPYAGEAKALTQRLVEHRTVRVVDKERDRYGRLVAWVTPLDGEELGAALVRAGLAWQHPYYSRDPELKRLEQEARRRGIGLWADPDPTPPWVWKRHHRRGSREHP
ncbi:MAG: thermonuclease family protein [Magnetococcales bacterium]|nr:thermonuclease family protein [Magnetococcales bacterium]